MLEQVAAAAARARARIEQSLGRERFLNFVKDMKAFSSILDKES
ncbi:hypothetical protein N7E02_13910 [Aliirhizobium terrae]|nr:hypothetical protein [Rhizobium sp. CC-CFT758]WJH41458.1 hypothetical protein N7E02_13910 [Rhizobium sp. CC-CFT758]